MVAKDVYFHGRGEAFAAQYAAVDGLEGLYQSRKVHELGAILRSTLLGSGSKVLDVAFGDGTFLRTVRAIQPDASAVGIDLSYGTCRAAPTGLPVVCGDAERLPFGDDSFDLVLLLDVIEHVPHGAPMLREVRRILRPAGTLLLTTPNRWGMYEYKEWINFGSPWYYRQPGAWLDLLSFRYIRYRPSRLWPYHTRLYTSGQMIREARACGFELVSATSINFSLPTTGLLDRLFGIAHWHVFRASMRALEAHVGGINHLLIQVYRKPANSSASRDGPPVSAHPARLEGATSSSGA